MKHTTRSGFVLVLTLMVLSLAVVIVTYLFNRGNTNIVYMHAMVEREKARMLALSGVQVAIAQLAQEIKVEQKKQAGTPATQTAPGQNTQQAGGDSNIVAQKLLERIVPTINRWQKFSLKESTDSIDGQIDICIVCEQGKLDINQMFDFKKHEWRGGSKILMQQLFKLLKKEDSFAQFEKFLKDRQYRLDDVTELLAIKGFETFKSHIFYMPPTEQEKDEKMRPLYLTDLFTVWSGKQTLDPWVFSDSLCGLLGLKRALANDIEQRKKSIAGAAKNFTGTVQWDKDWNKLLNPLYEKEFKSLPKGLDMILSTKFEPTAFSVLSYGKVGGMVQRVVAIIESTQQLKDNVYSFTVVIKKLYWI